MNLKNGATCIRRLKPEDSAPFLAYRDDPTVALYQSWDDMDAAQAASFLSHMHDVTPLMRPGHWTQVAISDGASGALIGDMGWFLNEAGDEIELGITLARSAQGRGHATRAFEMALQYLTQITVVQRFVAFADLRNTASCSLMRRVGFESLGTQTAADGVEEEAFEFRPLRAGD